MQRRITLDYAVGDGGLQRRPWGPSEPLRQLLCYVYEPMLSPWTLLLAMGLGGALGGLQPLTPVTGRRWPPRIWSGIHGTVQHAASLGAIVTVAHTF